MLASLHALWDVNVMLRGHELSENVHAQMGKGIGVCKVTSPPDVLLFCGKMHP